MLNIQYCAFYKHIHEKKKKITNSCSFSAAKNAAKCNQAAYGLTVAKCLHPAYTTGRALLEEISQLGFESWIKFS